MAFNFMAALGGAATAFSEFADEKTRKLEKQEDRDYETTREQNIYDRNIRDKAQSAYDALAEELAVYYNPEQVADIMSNGNGAAKHAITKGASYDRLGLKASEHYKMPNNDIKNISNTAVSLEPIPVSGVGSVSASAEEGTDTRVTDSPAGLGGEIFSNRFTVVADADDLTAAEFEARLLNLRLAAGDDKEKNAEVDKQEEIFLSLARKKAEAARKENGSDVEVEFYTVPQRENKIAKFETAALNQMGVMTGDLGSIKDKLKGTNTLEISKLLAVENLTIDNAAGYQEVAMGKLIEGRKTIALNGINQYAQSKYRTVDNSKIFQNQDAVKKAAKDGTLKPNDVYISFQKASIDSKGKKIPAQYLVGTYLGNMYKNIGVKPFQPAMYLGTSYIPPSIE